MARRKQETDTMEENYAPCFELPKGFYLLDEDRNLKTKEVTKGKPGEQRRVETVPICCRTIANAKDVVSVSSAGLAILCVTEDGFRYPC